MFRYALQPKGLTAWYKALYLYVVNSQPFQVNKSWEPQPLRGCLSDDAKWLGVFLHISHLWMGLAKQIKVAGAVAGCNTRTAWHLLLCLPTGACSHQNLGKLIANFGQERWKVIPVSSANSTLASQTKLTKNMGFFLLFINETVSLMGLAGLRECGGLCQQHLRIRIGE